MVAPPRYFHELLLEPEVLEALKLMGFETLTPVQAKAIPYLLETTDFVGQAPTGTGKTAAFGIPLVNRTPAQEGPRLPGALVVGPTRELVQQIADELNAIGQVKGVRAVAVYGGESVYMQKAQLRKQDADIIVGTPGRILDLASMFSLDLSRCRMVVLDEADEMLDMGFREDIEDIFKHLPAGHETWLFSATLSPEIRRIANRYMYAPQEVRIMPQQHSAEMIEQYYIVTPEAQKPDVLKRLLDTTPEMYGIVFCQTKKDVVQLTRHFRDAYPFVDGLHGAQPQHVRDRIMEDFRNRHLRILISTDVVGRGIDIDSLTHIINYQPPSDPESYIHRIGRTARKGETGIAITLFTPREGKVFRSLEQRTGLQISKHPLSSQDFEALPSHAPGDSRRRGGKSARPHGNKGGHPSSSSNRRRRHRGRSASKHPQERPPSGQSAKPSS